WRAFRSRSSRTERRSAQDKTPQCEARGVARLVEAEELEQRREVAELLARGGRGAADEVEDPAVLQPVIGETPDLTIFVEIDRNHPLVDDLLVHEGDHSLRA